MLCTDWKVKEASNQDHMYLAQSSQAAKAAFITHHSKSGNATRAPAADLRP